VTIALKVDNDPAQNLAATLQGDGTFSIEGSGIPGRTYQLQYSDSLTPTSWSSLGGATVTADPTGVISYIDTPPLGTIERHYRTVYP
jgi:hypothetical protein